MYCLLYVENEIMWYGKFGHTLPHMDLILAMRSSRTIFQHNSFGKIKS